MSAKHTHITDVVVVGAGLAAERSAIEAASAGLNVIILSLSATPLPQYGGPGRHAGFPRKRGYGKGDNPQIHFEDTARVPTGL